MMLTRLRTQDLLELVSDVDNLLQEMIRRKSVEHQLLYIVKLYS